jgi:hypothetical protein
MIIPRSVSRKRDFLFSPGATVTLRDRSQVASPGLRKPEMIALEEIAEGVIEVVTSNLGATDEELAMRVSRMLGFKATSSQLRNAIAAAVSKLLTEDVLMRSDGLLIVHEKTMLSKNA